MTQRRSASGGFAQPIWLIVGGAGAALLVIVLVAILKQPSPDAPPATAPRDADGVRAPAPAFGSSAPGERFIQAFQQRVTEELQATLDRARHDQQHELQQFEERSREQATAQLAALQRAVGEARAAGAALDPDGRPGNDVDPPRVHTRGGGHERTDGARADAPAGSDTGSTFGFSPADVRTIEGSGGTAPAGRLTVGLAQRGAPRAGEADVSPHGFVEGRLLNGVVAIVGGAERESIVALTGSYHGANAFETDLDGCFALVQGRPEPAAGRIDFKVSRLTCNFPDGASKTWDVAGWLVDGDGIRGVRATIVQSLDRKAAVAALGGAVGGIGRRLSQQQYQANSGNGGTTTTFTGSPGADALGGATEGAANAIQQSIGDYYQLFSPSLQVGGGTGVTVVIANELALPPSGRANTTTHTAAP
jgi:type F conjugative transfer system protein TrbI